MVIAVLEVISEDIPQCRITEKLKGTLKVTESHLVLKAGTTLSSEQFD